MIIQLLPLDVIPTNTVAFQQYALSVLLTQATFFAEQWKLDIPRPVTTNHITRFHAVPTPAGMRGNITLRDRYYWFIDGGRLETFTDLRFDDMSFLYNDDWAEVLAKTTNVLTMENALALARAKLKEIGIDERKHGLHKRPTKGGQWRYEWDGVIHKMPLFEFLWDTKMTRVQIQISGVTSNVADLFVFSPAASALLVPTPPNYLEMLGLPTNVVFRPHNYEILQKIEAMKRQQEEERHTQRAPPLRLRSPADRGRQSAPRRGRSCRFGRPRRAMAAFQPPQPAALSRQSHEIAR